MRGGPPLYKDIFLHCCSENTVVEVIFNCDQFFIFLFFWSYMLLGCLTNLRLLGMAAISDILCWNRASNSMVGRSGRDYSHSFVTSCCPVALAVSHHQILHLKSFKPAVHGHRPNPVSNLKWYSVMTFFLHLSVTILISLSAADSLCWRKVWNQPEWMLIALLDKLFS